MQVRRNKRLLVQLIDEFVKGKKRESYISTLKNYFTDKVFIVKQQNFSAVILEEKDTHKPVIGIAKRAPRDQFKNYIGITIATVRAIRNWRGV